MKLDQEPFDYAAITTPVGVLEIRASDASLRSIDFPSKVTLLKSGRKASLVAETARQLKAYFLNPAYRFDLPLEPVGTPFQQTVWQALLNLEYGDTQTYGGLAKQLNSGARAIGGACRRNPIPIIIPCHRVLRADGSLGGYNGMLVGAQPTKKAWLLAHEAKANGGTR